MQTREEFWREALSDFVQSGQSMLQYCRERRLSYHRALYWRRRLNAPGEEKLSFAVVHLPNQPPAQAAPSDSGVSVECDGHLIRLNCGFNESVLLRVMSVLSGREEG